MPGARVSSVYADPKPTHQSLGAATTPNATPSSRNRAKYAMESSKNLNPDRRTIDNVRRVAPATQ
jgi:hypothetical protein